MRIGSAGWRTGTESDFHFWSRAVKRRGQKKAVWFTSVLQIKHGKIKTRSVHLSALWIPHTVWGWDINIFIVFPTPLQTSKQVVLKCAGENSFSVALTELSAKPGPRAPLTLLLQRTPLRALCYQVSSAESSTEHCNEFKKPPKSSLARSLHLGLRTQFPLAAYWVGIR